MLSRCVGAHFFLAAGPNCPMSTPIKTVLAEADMPLCVFSVMARRRPHRTVSVYPPSKGPCRAGHGCICSRATTDPRGGRRYGVKRRRRRLPPIERQTYTSPPRYLPLCRAGSLQYPHSPSTRVGGIWLLVFSWVDEMPYQPHCLVFGARVLE